MKWGNPLRDPKMLGTAALLVLGGSLVNFFLVGYLTVFLVFFQESKLTAGENAFEFMTDPLHAASVLIFNGGTQPVEQSIHGVYTNGILQGAFWLLMIYVVYRLVWHRNPKHKKAAEEGSHGTADWQDPQEVKENYLKSNEGMILGEYKGKMAVHPLKNNLGLNSNALVFGGSGSYKTAGFVIPNILHIGETLGHSMILPDPKGELWNETSRRLRNLGYEVIPFNLLDKDKRRSARFNPMNGLKRDGEVMTDEVVELAHMIMEATKKEREDGFFATNAQDLLTALMLYVLEKRPKEEHHLRNVLFLASTVGKDQMKLRELFEQLPLDSPARSYFDSVDSDAEKQWEGIRGDMKSRLGLWNNPSVAELTATSDFDLNQLGKKKTALYLMMPDSDTTFSLLPALLITQAFKDLIQQADNNRNGALDVPVWAILDELGNLPKIRELDKKVNTVRSRKIYLLMIFQSFPQFQGHYGKLEAASIDASCDTTIYLGSKSRQTNEEFSKMLGNTTIQVQSTSRNKGKNERTGLSESFKERSLMTPDEVAKIRQNNESIIFQAGQSPVKLKKHVYFQQKKWEKIQRVHWADDIPKRKYEPVPLFEEALLEELPQDLIPE